MRNITNLRCTIFALTLLCLPTQSSAGTITFETRSDGTAPIDNEELTASYLDSSTTLTFGFDTDGDLNINVNARFERRGTDTIFAYVTDTDDDLDKTGTNEGGDWVLRSPKDLEPTALNISDGQAFLVKYSGTFPTYVSGEVWDIDSGEQYLIEAFDISNAPISSILSFIGQGGCCGGPTDGLPFLFTFTNLSVPTATVRITETQGERAAGFGFDNFSTTPVPEPGSGLLFLSGIAVLGLRLRRTRGARFSCRQWMAARLFCDPHCK
jgi:hypothetical protein